MESLIFVGIDVAKDWLDIAIRPEGVTWRVDHDPNGIEVLVERLAALRPTLVVLEGTGGLERMVLGALGAAGLAVAAINPRQARDFARATGKLAKTDRIDALALAHFAEAVRPAPRPLPNEQAMALRELVGRRRQLIDNRTAEQHRLERASPVVQQDITEHVAWLDKRIREVDDRVDHLIRQSPLWRTREDLLRSVPGVGPTLARTLLVDVPELGQVRHKALASLLGVAPHNRDSGRHLGKRSIVGGRARVRAVLYMATVAAIRCNPDVQELYHRLRAAGKLPKVALVACMRQLLITLNALVRDQRPWQPRSAQ